MSHAHNSRSPQCQALMAQISAYIDSDLEAHLCAELEAHLAGCDDCRVLLNSTQKTIELYRRHYRAKRMQLSTDVERRLHQVLMEAGCSSKSNEP